MKQSQLTQSTWLYPDLTQEFHVELEVGYGGTGDLIQNGT